MAKSRPRRPRRTNKSEAIRLMAEKLGPKARPRDIRHGLADQGIDVTAALVTNVLARSRKKAAGSKGRSASGRQPIGIDALIDAKKFVARMGSLARAQAALDALGRLLD